MTERTVYRGDGYRHQRCILTGTFVDKDLQPLDLSDSVIYATFRINIAPTDVDDLAAAMRCQIEFDNAGAIVGTPENFQLPDGGTAAEGVLEIVADPVTTSALPENAILRFDTVVHRNGGDPITVPTVWTVRTQDSYTNRA